MSATIDSILADFEILDDWEDRYRFVIELGKALPPLPARDRTDANKVRGCVSQVWLASSYVTKPDGRVVLQLVGDSDALIVRGLVAILITLFSGRTAEQIMSSDAEAVFARLGLKEHLTPQRSNGLASMLARIRADASEAIAGAR